MLINVKEIRDDKLVCKPSSKAKITLDFPQIKSHAACITHKYNYKKLYNGIKTHDTYLLSIQQITLSLHLHNIVSSASCNNLVFVLC